MTETVLARFDLDAATAARLWAAMDRESKLRAAQAFYDVKDADRDIHRGADKVIADAIRFRVPTVRKLPTAKKANYLATRVRPEEALAVMILQAHHLHYNEPMLGAFLDHLEIPHEAGHIKEDAEFDPPGADALAAAAKELYGKFDEAEVDLYLTTLYTLEGDIWGELRGFLDDRSK